jgi:RNA polymerase sigma factor (sigma-70 family)
MILTTMVYDNFPYRDRRSDEELIVCYRETGVFRLRDSLAMRHRPRVCGRIQEWGAALGLQQDDIADVQADSFFWTLEVIDLIDPWFPGHTRFCRFEKYLDRRIEWRLVDYLRKRQRREQGCGGDSDLLNDVPDHRPLSTDDWLDSLGFPEGSNDPAEIAEWRDEKQRLIRIWEELSVEEQLLLSRLLNGMSPQEIAAIEQVSVADVRRKRQRLIDTLSFKLQYERNSTISDTSQTFDAPEMPNPGGAPRYRYYDPQTGRWINGNPH